MIWRDPFCAACGRFTHVADCALPQSALPPARRKAHLPPSAPVTVRLCALCARALGVLPITPLDPPDPIKESSTMTRIPFRQGDVALSPVDSIPGEAIGHSVNRVVLALGEVTGHAHVLSAEVIEEFTDRRDPELERRFVRVLSEGGLLTHEEHGQIAIPPGEYEVIRQREYAPESTRFVAD